MWIWILILTFAYGNSQFSQESTESTRSPWNRFDDRDQAGFGLRGSGNPTDSIIIKEA